MPTTEHLIPRTAIGHGRRRRRWVGRLLLPVIVLIVGGAGYFAYATFTTNLGRPSCRAVALGHDVSFTPEQSANAATITAIALKRGLPARAATIANATAIQESKLRNIRFGDRDSLGLFQQRPSQGWGTEKQILDPVYASNKFYDALTKISGYQGIEITKVAQMVQRSATPQAYAAHEQEGRILASTLAGHSPGGFGCRLDEAKSSAPAANIAADLTAELGVPATTQGQDVHVTGRNAQVAWAAGSWAVAHAEADGITSVTVGDRAWTRERGSRAWSWHAADQAIGPTSVTITTRR
jgi:hypothetical protein